MSKNFTDLLNDVYSIPYEERGDYTILVTIFEGGEKTAKMWFKGRFCEAEVYALKAHHIVNMINNEAQWQWGMPVRIQIIEAKPQKKSRRVTL